MGRAVVAAVVAAVILALPTALAPSAAAHADLILSTPAADAQLATVPDQVTLTFSEDLLPQTVVVSVEDSNGMVIRVLELEVDGSDVIVAWPPGLSGSDYTVNYRVVSQDGHPVSGSLAFTVGTPTAADAASASQAAAPAGGAGTGDPAATDTGSAAPVAAIAAIAAIAVGISAGVLYLAMRRRGRSGPVAAVGPDSAS